MSTSSSTRTRTSTSTRRPARPARPALPALSAFESVDATHREVIKLLSQLGQLVALLAEPDQQIAAARRARFACTFFNGKARQHHDEEETKIFPRLLESGDPQMREHVRRLQQDHNWIEEDWLELEPHLEAVAQGYAEGHEQFLRAALPEFTTLYHEHMALEESLFHGTVPLR